LSTSAISSAAAHHVADAHAGQAELAHGAHQQHVLVLGDAVE
jgi:hypothetical protein